MAARASSSTSKNRAGLAARPVLHHRQTSVLRCETLPTIARLRREKQRSEALSPQVRRESFRSLRARLAAAAAAAILAAVVLFAVARWRSSTTSCALARRGAAPARPGSRPARHLHPAVLTEPGRSRAPCPVRQISVEVIDAPRAHPCALAQPRRPAAARGPRSRAPRAARAHRRGGHRFRRAAASAVRRADRATPEDRPPAARCWSPPTPPTSLTPTSHLGVLLALTGAGVALVAALAAAALTRRGLRPLRPLAAAAGEIERTADPRAGCREAARGTRSVSSPACSTGCSPRSRRRARASAASWPTPRTSCARR